MNTERCNQICKWNSPADGCIKPYYELCQRQNINVCITNADHIRAMSDEELAETLNGAVCPPLTSCNTGQQCVKCWIDWLQQPAEET